MTVAELIKELEKADPRCNVVLEVGMEESDFDDYFCPGVVSREAKEVSYERNTYVLR